MANENFSDDVCNCDKCRATYIRFLDEPDKNFSYFYANRWDESIPKKLYACDWDHSRSCFTAQVVDENKFPTGEVIIFKGKLADEILKLTEGHTSTKRLVVQIKERTSPKFEFHIKEGNTDVRD